MANNEVMSSISDALGMSPLVLDSEQEVTALEQSFPLVLAEEAQEPELTQAEKDAEEDFAFSRGNVKKVIEAGTDAIETLTRLANASESARTFEVLSKLVKDLSEANGNLMKLHEQRRQLAPLPEPEKKEAAPTQQITQQNVFVGTTAELLQMIKDGKSPTRQQEVIDVEHTVIK